MSLKGQFTLIFNLLAHPYILQYQLMHVECSNDQVSCLTDYSSRLAPFLDFSTDPAVQGQGSISNWTTSTFQANSTPQEQDIIHVQPTCRFQRFRDEIQRRQELLRSHRVNGRSWWKMKSSTTRSSVVTGLRQGRTGTWRLWVQVSTTAFLLRASWNYDYKYTTGDHKWCAVKYFQSVLQMKLQIRDIIKHHRKTET